MKIELDLEPEYIFALRQMAQEAELTENNLMRCALRYYQLIQRRVKEGQRLAFVDEHGQLIREPVGGCMGD